MLDPSPILGLTLVDPIQTGKFDAINALINGVESSTQDFTAHDLSSGDATVTAADFTTYVMHNATGNTVARELTFPATPRVFLVNNTGSADLTVTISGGTSVTVAADKLALLQSDGTDPTILAQSDVVSVAFTALGDVDSSYTGDASKRLQVNSDEDAIAYVTAGTETPPQIDKASEYTIVMPEPPSVGLTGFVKKRANRLTVGFIDTSRHVEDIETALFGKNTQMLVGAGPAAGSEAAITLADFAFGFAGGTSSTSIKNVNSDGTDSLFDLQRKSKLAFTSSLLGAEAYWSAGSLPFARGSVAGTGGFFAVFRFGVGDILATAPFFVGLGADIGSLAASWGSATTDLGACLGMIKDADDTTWSIVQKASGSTSFTKWDTTFPADTQKSDYFELRLYCDPCGVPYYSVERLNSGEVFEGQFDNSSTLPSTTTLLYPVMRSTSSASEEGPVSLHFSRLYFENQIDAI